MALPGTALSLSGSTSEENLSQLGDSEIRTVFVSGLPADIKEREIYLVFKTNGGYESHQLKSITKPSAMKSPVAFVTFKTKADAEKAISEHQNTRFDPASAQTMRLEFAKSNTKMTKPRTPQILHGMSHMLPAGFQMTPEGAVYQVAAAANSPEAAAAFGVPPMAYELPGAAALPGFQPTQQFMPPVSAAALQQMHHAQLMAAAAAATGQPHHPFPVPGYPELHAAAPAAMDAITLSKLQGFSVLNGVGINGATVGAPDHDLYYSGLAKAKMGELS